VVTTVSVVSETSARFSNDVAISAVRYDALAVAELTVRLAPVLATAPQWRGAPQGSGDVVIGDGGGDALFDSSRVAVVLHQRLWGRDGITDADALAFRERTGNRRAALVVALDHEPIPDWLAESPNVALTHAGVEQVAAFARDMVAGRGQHVAGLQRATPAAAAPAPAMSWREGPLPFLAQPRSVPALRRAFDDLAAELDARVRAEQDRSHAAKPALFCAPERLVVQLGDVGLSFSWMPGRAGTVADGRLLVIEWHGVVAHGRGVGASRTAKPGRERLFRPDAIGPTDWCWRSADAEWGAYSSRDLAGQTIACALLAGAA
jgi:hypothetical protein